MKNRSTGQTSSTRVFLILHLVLIGFILILARTWHLSVLQKEKHYEQSLQPKTRIRIEPAERAHIRDRYNIPLAINKLQYNAAVCYAPIRQIPSVQWKKDPVTGGKEKIAARQLYIQKLSEHLAKILQIDPVAIEDTILAKAALFPHTPFIVKEGISEEQYFQLKILEKEWPGLLSEKRYKRFYPQGKIASSIIGYLGPISDTQYLSVADEIKELKEYVQQRESGEIVPLPKGYQNPLEVRERLLYLQEKGYTINDLVGKDGIEKYYNEELRGLCGKRRYEVTTKGAVLRELPNSRSSTPGRRVILTLSSELQLYAETLLMEHLSSFSPKNRAPHEEPWIRGAALVAMDPNTGEILALASTPRFNPNDFLPVSTPTEKAKKERQVKKWLEAESYIGEIWDGQQMLEKEIFLSKENRFGSLSEPLTWDLYLRTVLNPSSQLFHSISSVETVKTALFLQRQAATLLSLSEQTELAPVIELLFPSNEHLSPSVGAEKLQQIRLRLQEKAGDVQKIRNALLPFLSSIPSVHDKLLFFDLLHLAVHNEPFTPSLLDAIGSLSISSYRALCQEVQGIKIALLEEVKALFHDIDFSAWRKREWKEFLQAKRKEEKINKRAVIPYTDYLAKQERSLFSAFWKQWQISLLETCLLGRSSSTEKELEPYTEALLKKRSSLVKNSQQLSRLVAFLSGLSPENGRNYLRSMRSFEELNSPLVGHYKELRREKKEQTLKDLAAAFYPADSFGYMRSYAYRGLSPAGSLFKLVTGYQALKERWEQASLADLNPLTLIDSLEGNYGRAASAQVLGYTLKGEVIKRLHKGGFLPRSHAGIGKIDLVGALENSSNIYFSLLASEHISSPTELIRTAHLFGYGEKSGIDLPAEAKGNLPLDLSQNRTDLYAFAIGQHSLTTTPVQTAVTLAAMVNGGKVLQPKMVKLIASLEPSLQSDPCEIPDSFAFQEDLALAGISFPLFSEAKKEQPQPYIISSSPIVKRELFFPPAMKEMLLKGMYRVVSGAQGTARPSIIRSGQASSQALSDYQRIAPYLIAKTGTAELYYKATLDKESVPKIKNQSWFGAISFATPLSENGPWDNPELVVIVFLQYGLAGKEGAPIAAQIVKKWREIQASHKDSFAK